MDDEAFLVLADIDQGLEIKPTQRKRWIPALKTIRWVVETTSGFALTPAGREALADTTTGRRQST